MCCLKYEQDAYEDLVKHAPKQESFVETPDGAGTVSSVNLLRQTVQVRLDSAPETPKCYQNCEICIVRNGKGKRPEGYVEPPLEELAKLRKPVEKEEVPDLKGSASPLAAALEAVFNGETPQYEGFDTPVAPAKPAKSSGRGRSRRRSDAPKPQQQEGERPQRSEKPARPSRPKQERPQRTAEKPQEKPADRTPKAESAAPAEGGEKRRRPRRRRPRGNGNGSGAPKAE